MDQNKKYFYMTIGPCEHKRRATRSNLLMIPYFRSYFERWSEDSTVGTRENPKWFDFNVDDFDGVYCYIINHKRVDTNVDWDFWGMEIPKKQTDNPISTYTEKVCLIGEPKPNNIGDLCPIEKAQICRKICGIRCRGRCDDY